MGYMLGPMDDSQFACRVDTSPPRGAAAGFWNISVRQDQENRGYASAATLQRPYDPATGVQFDLELMARVQRVVPTYVPITGGVTLRITGGGFGGDASKVAVKIGDDECAVTDLVGNVIVSGRVSIPRPPAGVSAICICFCLCLIHCH